MSEETSFNIADIVKKIRTKGSLYCKAVNSLDRTVMVQNQDLLSELSTALSRVPCQYETALVSWNLSHTTSGSLVVSCVLLMEHQLDSTKKYAVGVPQGLFVRADQALGSIVEFVMNCQRPEFVAGFLAKPNGVYMSGFETQQSAVVVPLIINVETSRQNELSFVFTRHPQLAEEELFAKTFHRQDCKFYSWTRYLAVLCANNRPQLSLEFFESENPDQVNRLMEPQVLEETEFVELQHFMGFIQTRVENLVQETN